MKTLVKLIILSFAIIACNSGHNENGIATNGGSDQLEDLLYIPSADQAVPEGSAPSKNDISKKVIKTGTIDFETKEINEAYKKISALLPTYGAYIEEENQSKTSQRITYYLTIRVPSNGYDTLLSKLSSIAIKADNKSSKIEDVTEQYYDLKSRIKNKQALEQRYIDLLDKATEIKDILAIEQNLNEIRTDIERLQGQFRYLSKQVSLSTIRLTFYEVLPYVYNSDNRTGFGTRLLNALSIGWYGFLSFLVELTAIWPFIILLGIGIYLFRKWRAHIKKKRRNNA